jgi:hypothetical protein
MEKKDEILAEFDLKFGHLFRNSDDMDSAFDWFYYKLESKDKEIEALTARLKAAEEAIQAGTPVSMTPEEIEGFGGPFNVALKQELDKLPYTNGLDDGQFNDGVCNGFELGAEWAKKWIEEHKFCQCNSETKTGCTSAMHCNICGGLEQTETWLR